MNWLPDVVRAYMPVCPPPILARITTFVLVVATVMGLLDRGVVPHDVLVLLGVVTLVTMVLTRTAAADAHVMSPRRAVLRALRGGVISQPVTA